MAGESTSGEDACKTSTRTLLTSTKLQDIQPKPQTPVVLRFDCTVDHALKVRWFCATVICAITHALPGLTVEDAAPDLQVDKLQVLSSQQILSAPVVACSEGDTPDDCTDVIGFVDIRDVLVSFLSGKLANCVTWHS